MRRVTIETIDNGYVVTSTDLMTEHKKAFTQFLDAAIEIANGYLSPGTQYSKDIEL